MPGLVAYPLYIRRSPLAVLSDPRTKDWFLISSPVPLLCLLVVYVYGCLRAGPWLMQYREPFKLTNTLIIYNAVQVVGSALLFWEVSTVI